MTFYSANVRHAIYIERYKARVVREIVALVNGVSNDLFTYIAASDLESMTRRELDRLLVQVRRIVNDGYGEITPRIADALEQFAVYEAEWTANAVTRAGLVADMGVPSDADLWSAMYSRPFQGRLLRDWLTALPANTAARVRQTIRQGYVDGLGSIEIARQIRGTRSRQGVMDISRRGSEAMVRTAVAHTSNAARTRTYKQNPRINGEQWVSVLDHRTSSICRARDGEIYLVGEGPRPPAHINCLTGDSLISASPSITGASKRWFNGEIIIIKTSGNRKLSCTPNHPVLTDKGWVAAGDLDFSHKIACRVVGEAMSSVDAQDDNTKPSISDVAETFLAHGGVFSAKVPISAPDFHGDGADGEVAIVGAYGALGIKFNSKISEGLRNSNFIWRDDAITRVSRFDLFSVRPFPTSGGLVRFFGQVRNLIWRCASHARLLLLGSVSRHPAIVEQYRGYNRRPRSEATSYPRYTNPVIEHVNNLLSVDDSGGALMLSNGRHISSIQSAIQNRSGDIELSAYLLGGNAFNVELDGLADLRRVSFSGHVFNLETVDGYYLTDNIVTHNCRSTMIPVTQGNRAAVETRPTYNDWLTNQPESVQDDILGPTRAQLFREGNYTVDRFVDQSGQEYTLDQLRQRDSDTFSELFGD
jgi:SPP1 gp7 family putative phage head morphogenesis protein